MPRIKYYYDPDTCSFESSKFDSKTLVRKSLAYFIISGIVMTLVFIYLFYYHEDRLTTKDTNNHLSLQIQQFDSEIDKLESDLKRLHKKDKNVYRTILKADPIKDDWSIDDHTKYGNSDGENMEVTLERLEDIQARIWIQKNNYNTLVETMKRKEEELKHMPSIRPVSTDLISGFGYRLHPILHVKKMHTGLDFQASVNTPVIATADGKIEYSGRSGNGYGIHIDIDHGYGYASKYAHLSKSLVVKGQKIQRGDLIGYSGNTGLTKGPHLHYEISKDGKKIDPVDYFYSDLDPEEFMEFKKQAQQFNESMD